MKVVGGGGGGVNVSQNTKMNIQYMKSLPPLKATGFNVREKSQEKKLQATFGAELLGKLPQ